MNTKIAKRKNEKTRILNTAVSACISMGAFSGMATAANASVSLEEIIVTATRRAESVQDIPISVTAVGGGQLASRGIVQTSDIAMMVPNLKVNSQYGDTQPNFSLRGVGVANEFNSNTASPIGVYVDEVYQAFRFTHGLQLYDLDRIEVVRGPQGNYYSKTTGTALTINYDISDAWQFTSVTGYSEADFDLHIDNDGSPQSIFDARYTAETKDINQDFRLAYTSDKLDFLVGAYYGKDTSDAVNDIRAFNVFPDAPTALDFNPGGSVNPNLPPTSLNAQHGYDQQRRSTALYTEGTYTFTDQIELTLGLRYTKDKLEFLDAFSYAYDDIPGTILFPFYPSFDQSAEDENISGRIIFNYIWSDEVRTYASYSRGYRSGTYNGFAYSSPTQVYFLEPEELDSYEIGFKSRFMDDSIQLNGAIFRYDYTNQQVQEIVGAIGFLRSLDAEVNGAELELQARPISSLTIRGSLGFLDSEYASGQSLSDVDIGGNWLPFASKWSGSIGGDLTLAQFDKGEIILTAEANYVSKYYYDPFNEDAPGFMGVLEQPGAEDYLTGGDYTLINARLSYDSEDFTIAAWGKNLSDKKYFPVGYDVTGAFGNTIYNAGTPRTYGLEATYRF